jgi:hypothetical protein
MPAPRALALVTSVTYPGTTEHIRIVRADLRAVLDECPMAEDVILCASELAANATVHSRSRLPGGTFTVRAKISPGGYAWIEVEDDGGPSTPEIRDSVGHQGLDIVRALATRLGHRWRSHHPHHLGKIRLGRLPIAATGQQGSALPDAPISQVVRLGCWVLARCAGGGRRGGRGGCAVRPGVRVGRRRPRLPGRGPWRACPAAACVRRG